MRELYFDRVRQLLSRGDSYKKVLSLIISATALTVFVAAPLYAKSTKEVWVKKKKADADRQDSVDRGMGGDNAGEARDHNRQVEEKPKQGTVKSMKQPKVWVTAIKTTNKKSMISCIQLIN